MTENTYYINWTTILGEAYSKMNFLEKSIMSDSETSILFSLQPKGNAFTKHELIVQAQNKIDKLEQMFDLNNSKMSSALVTGTEALLAIWTGFLDDMLEMEVN